MSGKKKSSKKAGSYFKDVKGELKKVSWPSRKEVVSSTLIVLFLTIIFSAFIGGFDYLFTIILKLISA
ncbi:preprotein translocase subunit SecE [Candidatus Oleimmundimicrobium sp.]|uniref:preprotein translocase subunit SecE n=1 Tax=Candidatus Oleimmundimicrobium sp. TaxID=3060597 RepID=UPI00271F3FD2|nr:preprotein translocase subunit SecE [Candidatus Oleimmundimicrobium sp.]MDO8885955.1 preprotein translocase subunit SecE [Candidatus Oleimmundimicrobium sp.]